MADQPDERTYVIPSRESEIPDATDNASQAGDDAKANPDTAGDPAGTAGTGGENKVQDSQFER